MLKSVHLLLLAAAATIPSTLLWLWIWGRRPWRRPHWLEFVGALHLAGLWMTFIPLNLLAYVIGVEVPLLFGSEYYDGGAVEVLTEGGLAGIVALSIAMALRRRAEKPVRLFWAVAAVAAFLALGEEMSWGQHMLQFPSPEVFEVSNLQKETNLHNFVSPRIYDYAYQIVGALMIAWALLVALVPTHAWPRPLRGLAQSVHAQNFAVPLLMTAGMLLQHEVFEELSEWAVIGTGFYVLTGYAATQTGRLDPRLASGLGPIGSLFRKRDHSVAYSRAGD